MGSESGYCRFVKELGDTKFGSHYLANAVPSDGLQEENGTPSSKKLSSIPTRAKPRTSANKSHNISS
nr:hypothetical protein P5665_10410 [Bacillus subtilis]